MSKVLSGHEVFKMCDTFGLPLDIINAELRDRGMVFNVAEFIDSAKNAGWKEKMVKNKLLYNAKKLSKELENLITLFIGKYYDKD